MMTPQADHIGTALVYASMGGLLLMIVAGRALIGRAGAILVYLTGAAGFILGREWVLAGFGVLGCLVVAAGGWREKRRAR